jgi:hypothetical protein
MANPARYAGATATDFTETGGSMSGQDATGAGSPTVTEPWADGGAAAPAADGSTTATADTTVATPAAEITASAPPAPVGPRYVVAGDTAPLRAQPTSSSALIGTLTRGTIVNELPGTALALSQGWRRVRWNDREGWTAGYLLQRAP